MIEPGFYNRDCMEAMKEFPDKFFDLAIVDPPYGIGADNFKNGSGASKDSGVYGTAVRCKKNRLNSGGGKLKNRLLNNSDCSWDSEAPQPAYFDELRRVSKNQIIWGGITSTFHLHAGLRYGTRYNRGRISARSNLHGHHLINRLHCSE